MAPVGGGGGPPIFLNDEEPVVLDDITSGEGALGESYNAYNRAAALGRIGGKLLKDNLLRNGVDLTFRNLASDPDLLYLDVTNKRIGINISSPTVALDLTGQNIVTKGLEATGQAQIGNVLIQAPNTFSTVTGPLAISPADIGTPFQHKILQTSGLEIRANYIGSLSNGNIVLDPNGSGTVEFTTTTNTVGDVDVTGNIFVQGNVKANGGNITIGDQATDTVTISPNISQDLLPSTTNTVDIGSASKKWQNIYTEEWRRFTNLNVNALTINNNTKIDGVNNTLFDIATNDTLTLSPGTGVVNIENISIKDSDITNLSASTPLQLASTGNGYWKFADSNGFVLPSGTDAEAPVNPEPGFTRWNTDKGYVECYDGSVYIIATGPGDVVNRDKMEEYVNLWTFVLG